MIISKHHLILVEDANLKFRLGWVISQDRRMFEVDHLYCENYWRFDTLGM